MPLAEMFRISGFEVLLPTVDDFIFLFPNDFKDIGYVTLCQTSVHRQSDVGFDPELPFAF